MWLNRLGPYTVNNITIGLAIQGILLNIQAITNCQIIRCGVILQTFIDIYNFYPLKMK